MAVDNPTHPFTPTVTDRHRRWPAVNDLDDVGLPDVPAAAVGIPAPAAPVTATPAMSSPLKSSPEKSTPARLSTRVETFQRRRPADHAALPPVGDFWDLQNPDRLVVSPSAPFRPIPYAPPAPTRRRAPAAASVALISGLLSLPMTIALGFGAALGMIAIISGAVAVRQINRSPGSHRGKAAAVTGIVTGTGGVLIGGPILLLVLLIAAA
ncbi:DUF4190 domain-containing protein [Gordonia jinghuaiqii]|uniref:DUF4190 domain-containing protein n=1 Tax=Gordonia jinghuaiqii TaxID=2758710 RepID=A0A7D7LU63_9ACTN|nr:DUF4190 domain-containing protein [Gordonia jinghuaiqii]MCR5979486.1 DUF4190 domain-containing protein [Gordonia jinghuaiqii]QMT00715.1 DUF4190 domain-containing protein [Gordonia jinghuaiqii]